MCGAAQVGDRPQCEPRKEDDRARDVEGVELLFVARADDGEAEGGDDAGDDPKLEGSRVCGRA